MHRRLTRARLERLRHDLTIAGVHINALYNDLACNVLSHHRGRMLRTAEADVLDDVKRHVDAAGHTVFVMWNAVDALLWALEDV